MYLKHGKISMSFTITKKVNELITNLNVSINDTDLYVLQLSRLIHISPKIV